MAIEAALIQHSLPLLRGRSIERILAEEAGKGRSTFISQEPVSVTPPCRSLRNMGENHVPEPNVSHDYQSFRIWMSPGYEFDWVRSERFIKELLAVKGPVLFEIYGNEAGIQLQFGVSRADVDAVQVAFTAEHSTCQLTRANTCRFRNHLTQSSHFAFRDYYPVSVYHENLTCSSEFRYTPLEALLCALGRLPEDTTGFYQCIMQPATGVWHENVAVLYDLHYLHSSYREGNAPRYGMQLPSSELHMQAQRMERKAHPDKPMFAAALRIGVVSDTPISAAMMQSLCSFTGLFQHGSRALAYLSERDYSLSTDSQCRMLELGAVHRHGFIVNSQELAGLVHLFDSKVVAEHRLPIEFNTTLSPDPGELSEGVVIGMARSNGEDVPVCIASQLRERSVHLIGVSGSGKTSVMVNMALQDAGAGQGVVFIDPHGDAVRDILARLSEQELERTIWFDPGDPDYVPLWNPLALGAGANAHRLADDLLSSIERVSTAWGDRLAHILRNGLLGLIQAKPDATLSDLYDLIRKDSPEAKRLRTLIVNNATDETVRNFWKVDFLKDYQKGDLAAPKHKLHKLISSQPVFCQSECRINLPTIMNEGRILLVDLSSVGAETRKHLGSFMLTQVMIAALARSKVPYTERKPFGVFLDEAHLFVGPETIEDMIAQTRKYRIRLTLAHQYLKQFGRAAQIDALSTVGSTLIGRIDRNDAGYFAKDLSVHGITADNLVGLKKYHMVARLDTCVCTLKTRPLPEPVHTDLRGIIQDSYRKYYTPAKRRRQAGNGSSSAKSADEEFFYDEF
ncbi:ATP-binding protein [Ruficoccus amylovorans]|uniref:ATP-binding protein n=1 Tax=Ruficoccus amylovorans TaxID=1804625 RepID=A0A842H8A6_9BACT|nr:type IV secretion system DNA-binding domain-containing protein [Ruficoccus amylovorans]MBC2592763.1 ATP-binding protein [Ruficoccus amylovorans]